MRPAAATFAKAGTVTAGGRSHDMGMGPVQAMRKAAERAGLKLDDLDVIELNEAFAAQSPAVVRELGLAAAKVNVHGAASLCVSGGMGTAMVIEVA
jgi:acetyl-CoA acyltransferase